ncbi:DtxR family transcriptional regulator [Aminobacterium colombiense]|uniref:metal-dependent transcriptional regulator n=1 Tax=Aminobacterium colombiense TaxID=81468 RepID=UPI0023536B28|nr:metal-dependent transcriptional regulator [Aminobacterium colombiense]MDD2379406.1 metal-dependent transcriptional regulator [Aminobacterium colombiense]MDD3768552.1 metal-dependent transcriptional regulator [Aminobacterium colombiense]MDD4265899.1 metal-dependent transcriptional regulator [Aminobacterium colombiense]MDD4586297.1 metal-dependent transcriptional regulator [Aminobacterium colombiense]
MEDYLEEIFALEMHGDEATVTLLSERLDVTKGTVVSAIKKLVEADMLDHERYGSVALTEKGREQALNIYRRHAHLSFLFTEILGFDKEKAQNLACIMEHEMDSETDGRLFALTDYFCQALREGAAWFKELRVEMDDPSRLPTPLVALKPGMKGIVNRVTSNGLLRKRLMEMGLVPGTEITFLKTSPLGDPLEFEIGGRNLALRRSEAATVWVRRKKENESHDAT